MQLRAALPYLALVAAYNGSSTLFSEASSFSDCMRLCALSSYAYEECLQQCAAAHGEPSSSLSPSPSSQRASRQSTTVQTPHVYVARGTGVCRDATGNKVPSWGWGGKESCDANPQCSGYATTAKKGRQQFYCQTTRPFGNCVKAGDKGGTGPVVNGSGAESTEPCWVVVPPTEGAAPPAGLPVDPRPVEGRALALTTASTPSELALPACLSLCGSKDVARFHYALPTVRTEESPWYPYLRRVYSGPVDLPLRLRDLEIFYTDWLPLDTSCPPRTQGAPRPPAAPTAACDPWFPHGTEAAEPVLQEYKRRLTIKGYRATDTQAGERSRGPLRAFTVSLKSEAPPSARYASDGAWVEVSRIATPSYPTEGSGYGCWWTAAVGSGVFLNLGRTRGFASRVDAYQAMGSCPNSEHCQAAGPPGTPNASCDGVATPTCDAAWAPHLRRNRYDSAQILGPREPTREILIASPACMDQPVLTACPHGQLLRTGWRHSLPCRCAAVAQMERPLALCTHDAEAVEERKGESSAATF